MRTLAAGQALSFVPKRDTVLRVSQGAAWVTLGIGWLVWYHRVSGRIGEEQAARGLPVTVTASTFWLWGILGSLIAVGPFIYIYKLLHAMNDLSADYNVRGF